jgi:hypothetical protein
VFGHRGEPDVPGAGGVPALLLEVLKKRADPRRVGSAISNRDGGVPAVGLT